MSFRMKLCLYVILVYSWVVDCSPLDARASTFQCNEDNVLRALEHSTPGSYSFCSGYISQRASPVTITVTTATYTYIHSVTPVSTIHPLSLYPLQKWSSTQKPITYTDTAIASRVPGSPQTYRGQKRDLEDRAATTTTPSATASSVPSYLATVPPSRISSGCSCLLRTTVTVSTYLSTDTTTTICTSYTPLPTATYPAFCAPTALVDQDYMYFAIPNTTQASIETANKLDCCAYCATVFNCIWWEFDAYKYLDPWSTGNCRYGFYTGYNASTLNSDTPAICPNGMLNLVGNSYAMEIYQMPRDPNGLVPLGREDTLYRGGAEQGPCGKPYKAFQASTDPGYPDADKAHFCSK